MQISFCSGPTSSSGGGQMTHNGWFNTDSDPTRHDHPETACSPSGPLSRPASSMLQPQSMLAEVADKPAAALPLPAPYGVTTHGGINFLLEAAQPTGIGSDGVSFAQGSEWDLEPLVGLDGLDNFIGDVPGEGCGFEDLLLDAEKAEAELRGAPGSQQGRHLSVKDDEDSKVESYIIAADAPPTTVTRGPPSDCARNLQTNAKLSKNQMANSD
jgi:hypothetical protein